MAGWNSLIQNTTQQPAAPPVTSYPNPVPEGSGRIQLPIVSPKRITGKSPVNVDLSKFKKEDRPWRYQQQSLIPWVMGPVTATDKRRPPAPTRPGEMTPRQRRRIALRNEQLWREMLRKEMIKKEQLRKEHRELKRRERELARQLADPANLGRDAEPQPNNPEPQQHNPEPPPRVRFQFPPPAGLATQSKVLKSFSPPRGRLRRDLTRPPRAFSTHTSSLSHRPMSSVDEEEPAGRMSPFPTNPTPPINKAKPSNDVSFVSTKTPSPMDKGEPPSLMPSLSVGGSSAPSPDFDANKIEEEVEEVVQGKGKGKAKDQRVRFATTVESISDEEITLPAAFGLTRKRDKPIVVPFFRGYGSVNVVDNEGTAKE
ncbi:hypothetical protein F4782DRAFT_530270 [Xylaria castorea]|nr:hypothetical protein F4782DRAFT_530270 [Xylaria castorea]